MGLFLPDRLHRTVVMLANRPENAWGSSFPPRGDARTPRQGPHPRRTVFFGRRTAVFPPFTALPLPVRPERELAPAGAASPRPALLVDELQTRVGVLLPACLGQRAGRRAPHAGAGGRRRAPRRR